MFQGLKNILKKDTAKKKMVDDGKQEKVEEKNEKPIEKSVEKPEKVEKKDDKPAKPEIAIDKSALKSLRLVVVAYSHVEREWFPTKDSYDAEIEVEDRAEEVVEEIEKLGVKAKLLKGDQ